MVKKLEMRIGNSLNVILSDGEDIVGFDILDIDIKNQPILRITSAKELDGKRQTHVSKNYHDLLHIYGNMDFLFTCALMEGLFND